MLFISRVVFGTDVEEKLVYENIGFLGTNMQKLSVYLVCGYLVSPISLKLTSPLQLQIYYLNILCHFENNVTVLH